MGFHIFRVLLSCFIFKLKQSSLFFLVSKEDRDFYKKNGYLIKENFLSQSDLEEIKRGLASYNGELYLINEGLTKVNRILISGPTGRGQHFCDLILENKKLLKLLQYTSANLQYPQYFAENLTNMFDDPNDQQKHLHKDTFHPTMKAWIFLNDVPSEAGPLEYVPTSHRLTFRRLKWEYLQSLKLSLKLSSSQDDNEGSFRVSQDDLDLMSLPEIKKFSVKENTLVIANTLGFHRRGQSKKDTFRLSIWINSRINPFNPFFGLRSKFFLKLRDNNTHRSYLNLGRRNEKANNASLVIIDSKFIENDKKT